ncbi:MAG: hypothetical protein D6811_05125 [Alphaproteobacteria bacterium]|nr:MAG: hypothetical protein D6811_05125 [Alphaproteobacteria bacterium]
MTRKTVIQAKIESSYSVDPGSWAASDAIQVSNPQVTFERDEENRGFVRGYLGASDFLITARRAQISFDVELAGSGSAGTAPKWGPLIRACGFAETITAGSRVEYTPISTGFESLALRYVVDGVVHLALGARGTASMKLDAYGRPMVSFTFTGIDSVPTAASVSGSFSGWTRPEAVTPAANADLFIGASYATGALSGGTNTPMRTFSIDLGNTVSHKLVLNSEAIEITDRAVSGSLAVELSAGDEVSWMSDIRSGVAASIGFQHGSSAGNIVVLHAGSVQRRNPSVQDYQGNVLFGCDLTMMPSSGDDELTVCVR